MMSVINPVHHPYHHANPTLIGANSAAHHSTSRRFIDSSPSPMRLGKSSSSSTLSACSEDSVSPPEFAVTINEMMIMRQFHNKNVFSMSGTEPTQSSRKIVQNSQQLSTPPDMIGTSKMLEEQQHIMYNNNSNHLTTSVGHLDEVVASRSGGYDPQLQFLGSSQRSTFVVPVAANPDVISLFLNSQQGGRGRMNELDLLTNQTSKQQQMALIHQQRAVSAASKRPSMARSQSSCFGQSCHQTRPDCCNQQQSSKVKTPSYYHQTTQQSNYYGKQQISQRHSAGPSQFMGVRQQLQGYNGLVNSSQPSSSRRSCSAIPPSYQSKRKATMSSASLISRALTSRNTSAVAKHQLLSVDCSIEYDLPNIPKPTKDSQPILMIHPDFQQQPPKQLNNTYHQTSNSYISNSSYSGGHGLSGDNAPYCFHRPCDTTVHHQTRSHPPSQPQQMVSSGNSGKVIVSSASKLSRRQNNDSNIFIQIGGDGNHDRTQNFHPQQLQQFMGGDSRMVLGRHGPALPQQSFHQSTSVQYNQQQQQQMSRKRAATTGQLRTTSSEALESDSKRVRREVVPNVPSHHHQCNQQMGRQHFVPQQPNMFHLDACRTLERKGLSSSSTTTTHQSSTTTTTTSGSNMSSFYRDLKSAMGCPQTSSLLTSAGNPRPFSSDRHSICVMRNPNHQTNAAVAPLFQPHPSHATAAAFEDSQTTATTVCDPKSRQFVTPWPAPYLQPKEKNGATNIEEQRMSRELRKTRGSSSSSSVIDLSCRRLSISKCANPAVAVSTQIPFIVDANHSTTVFGREGPISARHDQQRQSTTQQCACRLCSSY